MEPSGEHSVRRLDAPEWSALGGHLANCGRDMLHLGGGVVVVEGWGCWGGGGGGMEEVQFLLIFLILHRHTHARARAHTHARTHAHMHSHIHTCTNTRTHVHIAMHKHQKQIYTTNHARIGLTERPKKQVSRKWSNQSDFTYLDTSVLLQLNIFTPQLATLKIVPVSVA